MSPPVPTRTGRGPATGARAPVTGPGAVTVLRLPVPGPTGRVAKTAPQAAGAAGGPASAQPTLDRPPGSPVATGPVGPATGLEPVSRGRYPHGTRPKYTLEHCHCDPCIEANRKYERDRARAKHDGTFDDYMDAKEARDHIKWLSSKGVGRRVIIERTGLSESTICHIKCGRSKRCRRSTTDKILLVFPGDAADRALIDARPTWKLLDDMIAHGFTRQRLARELGSVAQEPSLQVGKKKVTALKARQVKALHARLMVRVIAERELMAARRRRYR